MAVAVAAFAAARRIQRHGGACARRNLHALSLGVAVHAAAARLRAPSSASSKTLQDALFPAGWVSAAAAACLVARWRLAPRWIARWVPRAALRVIVTLVTPGLLWNAFAETEDPIADADPCALVSLVLSLLLGGRHNISAAGVILLMLTGGEALEEYALRRAGNGVRALIRSMRLGGSVRRVVPSDGSVVSVEARDLCVGDTIQLSPGERVPADGVVVGRCDGSNYTDGHSGATTAMPPPPSIFFCDESAVTGEPGAVSKRPGELVYSGSVILQGTCTLLLRRRAEDSVAGLIQSELQAALEDRRQAPMERSCADAARALAPIASCVAAMAFFAHGRRSPRQRWEIVLAVLMAATPCPLSIGVPVAFLSARGAVTRAGITLKSGGALEQLARVTCVLLDKTGTLTTGRMTIIGAVIGGGADGGSDGGAQRREQNNNNNVNHSSATASGEDNNGDAVLTPFQAMVLHAVAAVERKSDSVHAVALAFQRAAARSEGYFQSRPVRGVEDVQAMAGQGVSGRVLPSHEFASALLRSAAAAGVSADMLVTDGVDIVVGSEHFVRSTTRTSATGRPEPLRGRWEGEEEGDGEEEQQGLMIGKNSTATRFEVCVAVRYGTTLLAAGRFLFADPLRPDAVSFVRRLRDGCGLRVLLVSGDSSPALGQVACAVGLGREGEDWHRCLPEAKAGLVKRLRAEGERVLMVGDGMNDAAALAVANVAVAVGSNDLVGSVSDVVVGGGAGELSKVIQLLAFSKRTLHIARRGVIAGMAMSSVQMVCSATGLVPPLVNAILQELVDVSTVVHAIVSPSSHLEQANEC